MDQNIQNSVKQIDFIQSNNLWKLFLELAVSNIPSTMKKSRTSKCKGIKNTVDLHKNCRF